MWPLQVAVVVGFRRFLRCPPIETRRPSGEDCMSGVGGKAVHASLDPAVGFGDYVVLRNHRPSGDRGGETAPFTGSQRAPPPDPPVRAAAYTQPPPAARTRRQAERTSARSGCGRAPPSSGSFDRSRGPGVGVRGFRNPSESVCAHFESPGGSWTRKPDPCRGGTPPRNDEAACRLAAACGGPSLVARVPAHGRRSTGGPRRASTAPPRRWTAPPPASTPSSAPQPPTPRPAGS